MSAATNTTASVFDARSFARAELARDPYASPAEMGAQIADACAALDALMWSPPSGYPMSPEAVAQRLEADRAAEDRALAIECERAELEDDEYSRDRSAWED